MSITYTNAKGQTFSLCQGTTKTGKPKYYFAMQSEGTLAKAMPAADIEQVYIAQKRFILP